MNFSDFITDHGKRISKEHLIHLIQVSRTDGKISSDEMELLHKEGKKFGLTEPEIDTLILSEKEHHYQPPYSLSEKFDHIYNIAGMILADDVIDAAEMKMIKRFAIEAGFADNIVEDLIALVLEGVKNGEDEEKLFKTFKTKVLK